MKNSRDRGGAAVFTKQKAARVAFTGILGALALSLSFLESLLPPLPMLPPGAKLGLSNIAAMYAAGSMGLPCALFLAVLKGGFAFLGRGLAAGAMSLSGGLLSTLAACFLLRRTRCSLMGVGVSGALTHNAAQLGTAWLLTSQAVLFYVPGLILFGILAGLLTGLALKLVLPPLKKLGTGLGVWL